MDIGGRKDRSQRTRWMPADAPEDPDQTTDLKVLHERSGQADSGCTAIRTAKPADGRGRRWTSMDTPGRSCNRAVEDPARCSYRCSNNRGCRRTWADVGGLREQIQALGHLVLSVPSKRTVAEKRPRAAHRVGDGSASHHASRAGPGGTGPSWNRTPQQVCQEARRRGAISSTPRPIIDDRGRPAAPAGSRPSRRRSPPRTANDGSLGAESARLWTWRGLDDADPSSGTANPQVDSMIK